MTFCSNCGEKLLDSDMFCPKCRTPTGPVVPIEKKIDRAVSKINDISLLVFGIPFTAFGIGFLITVIVVSLIKCSSAFLSATIGMLWGILISAIFLKIGDFIFRRVENETLKSYGLGVSAIIGIILCFLMVPSYLAKVCQFY
jgi:hypothetical protein